MTAPLEVVVVASQRSEVAELLPSAGGQLRLSIGGDEAALREPIKSAEVLFLWDYRSDLLRSLWPLAKALRWVHVSAAGVDAVMFPELRASSVMVTNSRGVFDNAVAEYGLALMLAHCKRLRTVIVNQLEARWQHLDTEELAGKTVTVVGLGAIGRRLAEKAQALGMTVVGVRRATPGAEGGSTQSGKAGLRSALGQGDYVVITLPLTDETQGLIGVEELRAMKPTAFLINLGRGGTVDEPALCGALEAGTIAGAALDVFEQEPLPPESSLWRAPNVLISPHMAGDSSGWQRRVMELFLRNLDRYRRGAELLNVVDKARGY